MIVVLTSSADHSIVATDLETGRPTARMENAHGYFALVLLFRFSCYFLLYAAFVAADNSNIFEAVWWKTDLL